MADSPAINASPLIFLAKAGYVELLQILSPEIIVPSPVFQEITSKPSDQATCQAFEKYPWLKVIEVKTVPPIIQAWDLGPGESSVLAWASLHPPTEIILDDLAGRRCAKSLHIPFRGTLGIVLLAKQRAHIPLARPVLEELIIHGMYLSQSVIDQALALVRE